MRARSLGVKMVSVAVVLVTAAYLLYVRPWQLRWGAIDEEIERPMPGDEIVKRPPLTPQGRSPSGLDRKRSGPGLCRSA
jgi:hypothetical protein